MSATYLDLLAVQPCVGPDDYASASAYAAAADRLARRGAGLVAAAGPAPDGSTPPVLAVWPEMVGAFLGLVGRAGAVRGAGTTAAALARVGLRMPGALAAAAARHRVHSAEEAFLTATAPATWAVHAGTFAALARRHGWWVVAGTALLPRNAAVDQGVPGAGAAGAGAAGAGAAGAGAAGAGAAPGAAGPWAAGPRSPLPGPPARLPFRALPGRDGARVYNTALTFAPDGSLAQVTRKVNIVPTQEDVLHLSAGDPADLGVVDTPFGRLGTLVCYDGFAEPHTSDEPGWTSCAPLLDAAGAVVLAQPSANAWAWDAPWAFNGPGEHQLRREQWFAEGLFAQLPRLRSVRWVVNPQLVGRVLDNRFEAPSLVLVRRGGAAQVLARSADPRAEDVLHVRVALGR